MRGSSAHEAAATGPFAQLELLHRAGDQAALGGGEAVRIVPGVWAGMLAVVKKMAMPMIVGRGEGGGSGWGGGHPNTVKYFV